MSRYTFESKIFEDRKVSSLSVSNINNIMINAEKEVYGEGLDVNYLHPYMWICKSHYYSAEESLYNFPYTFGLLFAKGLYAMYVKHGNEFVENYDKLLEITGKNNILEITKTIRYRY